MISGIKLPQHSKSIGLASLALLGIGLYSKSDFQTLASVDYPEDSFQQYLEFVAKYGKTNQNEAEFQFRFLNFKNNYKFVKEHNESSEYEGIELAIN